MRFLLFQIYAPIVSWGEIAVGGERQSSRHPSKSAIIGLIAAALGIKREEEELLNSLSDNLGIAVQLHSGGQILKDFHTVQVPRSKSKVVYHTRREELLGFDEKDNAIISRREYRCDALSVIAVYLKNEKSEFSLEKIEGALREPSFHQYFGRKSCVPALPLAPLLIEKSNLKEAFVVFKVKFPLSVNDRSSAGLQKVFSEYPQKTLYESKVSYFWEEGVVAGLEPLHIVERYDQPLSRKRWQFGARKEYMAIENKEEAEDVYQ